MADNDDNKRRRSSSLRTVRYGKFGKTKAYELIAQNDQSLQDGSKTLIDLDSIDEYHASLPWLNHGYALGDLRSGTATPCAGSRDDWPMLHQAHAFAPIGCPVVDAANLVFVALASCAAPPRPAPPLFFVRFMGKLSFTTSPSNAPSSLSKVEALERKPCAQWSPPGRCRNPYRRALVDRVSDIGTSSSWENKIAPRRQRSQLGKDSERLAESGTS